MAKPISNTPAIPLTFEQRLKVVQAEVRARVSVRPAMQQSKMRHRLWLGWVLKNLLEDVV